MHRANQLLQSWNMNHNINVSVHKGMDNILVNKGIDKEIQKALQIKVMLPCGGYLFIQQTEALTVVDVNSGKFTSGASQAETIRKTNIEAIDEIARQLRLRNIGGMIIIDFIDMDNRADKLAILEHFEAALEPDKACPQIGQISDLGLVELTRHRQGQSLQEIFTKKCTACNGTGYNRVQKTVKAKIPAGIDNGQSVRLSSMGSPGENGGPRGDLYVAVTVAQHPILKRQGVNIYSTISIDVPTACLGGEVKVKTIDGDVMLTIKPGTQSDTKTRLKGKGVPLLRSPKQRGDHFVTIVVNIPTNLTKEQKEILQKLREIS